MIIKIEVRTPPGHASKTAKKIKPFIFGVHANRVKHTLETNDIDDLLTWIVDGDARRLKKIIRNVHLYTTMIKGVFNNKLLKKASNKMNQADQDTLHNMLANQTSITVEPLSPEDYINKD